MRPRRAAARHGRNLHALVQRAQQLFGRRSGHCTGACPPPWVVRAGAPACAADHRVAKAGGLERRCSATFLHALAFEIIVQRGVNSNQRLQQADVERFQHRVALVALKAELVDRVTQRAAETHRMKWIFAFSQSRNLQRLGQPLRQWRERGFSRVANARRKAIDHHRLFHLVVLDQRQAQRVAAGGLRGLFFAAGEQLVDGRIDVAVDCREKRIGEFALIDQQAPHRFFQRRRSAVIGVDRLNRFARGFGQQRIELHTHRLAHLADHAMHGRATGASWGRSGGGAHRSIGQRARRPGPRVERLADYTPVAAALIAADLAASRAIGSPVKREKRPTTPAKRPVFGRTSGRHGPGSMTARPSFGSLPPQTQPQTGRLPDR